MSDNMENYNYLLRVGLASIVALVLLGLVIKKIYNLFNNDTINGTENVKKKLLDFLTPDYDSVEKNNNKEGKNMKSDKKPEEEKIQQLFIDSNNDNETNKKIIRFATDYCRSCPEINMKSKKLINLGWRYSKYNLIVYYETLNEIGEKNTKECLLTLSNTTRSTLNFNDDNVRANIKNMFLSLNHHYIHNYIHFDFLVSHSICVKIQEFNEYGSLRDLIYKTNPKDSFNEKYPFHSKGTPLNLSLISLYGRQILETLNFLHKINWYHLNLHSGNVLLDKDSIKLTELENYFIGHIPRNDQYFNFIFEGFMNENKIIDGNSSILSQIFKSDFNIFEKIDIVSFGRILYEMSTGRELRCSFPDESEYSEIPNQIVEILKLIFKKKTHTYANISHTISYCDVPNITVKNLLDNKFFKNELTEALVKTPKEVEFSKYSNYLKFQIFDQEKYLSLKIKNLNFSHSNLISSKP